MGGAVLALDHDAVVVAVVAGNKKGEELCIIQSALERLVLG